MSEINREKSGINQTIQVVASDSMKRVISLVIRNYKKSIIVVLIGIIISALVNSVSASVMQNIIDNFIIPLTKESTPDYTPLLHEILRLIVIFAIGVTAYFTYNRIMVNVGQGTMRVIRRDLFAHMEKLPIRYFDTHSHGDIMSIYTNDTDTLRQFIGISFPQLVDAIFSLVAVFITMLFLSPVMTVVSVIMIFISVQASGKAASMSGKYFGIQQSTLGKVNGYIEEMISGQKVVKVFNYEEKNIDGFVKINNELCDASTKANGFANILMPIVAQIGNLSYVVIAVVGGYFAISGHMGVTVGTIAAFLSLVKAFNRPFMTVSQQLNAVVMAAAGSKRVFELMDEPVEEDEGYVTLVNAKEDKNGNISETTDRTGVWAWKHKHGDGKFTYTKLEGNIVFEDVDFGYNPNKIVLHNINLYADKGQKIAFVGSTGAGKTTVTNLINRFYDIQSGKIRYDGINIEKIKKEDLRRSLGVVLQETNLFSDTVIENIRYGRPDATDEECMAAARLANADGFIERLPDGYNTFLHEGGANLSQGQKQLLSIARAALADPPVLILDEATSSIDTRTEQLVQAGMDSLMSGRTTFVIAHRLSTIKNSDVIMVLEQGRIIERGSHESLLEQKGRYYQLYTGKVV
jgi:multidrug ABC transporter, permease/ATP-binding protein